MQAFWAEAVETQTHSAVTPSKTLTLGSVFIRDREGIAIDSVHEIDLLLLHNTPDQQSTRAFYLTLYGYSILFKEKDIL